MKNKNLNKILCITLASAMLVPGVPVGAMEDAVVVDSGEDEYVEVAVAAEPEAPAEPVAEEPASVPEAATEAVTEPSQDTEESTEKEETAEVPSEKPTQEDTTSTEAAETPAPTETPEVTEAPTPTETPVPGSSETAEDVIRRIDELHVEGLTLADQGSVQAIRSSYDALSEEEKAQITNYEKLVLAENRIRELEEEQNALKEAQDVIQRIEDLDLDALSLEDLRDVEDLRDDYDALSAKAREKVYNYGKLEDAEDILEDLKKEEEKLPLNIQRLLQGIRALNLEKLSLEDGIAVADLRAEYDALSDEEKQKITNYEKLEKAEKILVKLELEEETPLEPADPDKKVEDGLEEEPSGSVIEETEEETEEKTETEKKTYTTNMVSNVHAGKGFYLDSLKASYGLTFSDDFVSVMDSIEKDYKEKYHLTDKSDSTGLTSDWDNLLVRNWQDILAVYIYEQHQQNPKAEEFKLDKSCRKDLARIFRDMNPITQDEKNEKLATYGNYHINDYIRLNNIAGKDRKLLKKYVETDCKLLCAIVTGAKGFVRESVGDNVSEERVNVITAAYSLIGKVGYFWGGKSNKIGYDPSWGTAATEVYETTEEETVEEKDKDGNVVEKIQEVPSRVTSLKAYGLDCSGFVTWSVINGYRDQDMEAVVGHGTSVQWLQANVVSEADAQPGDFVFMAGPEAGSDNHVGIICGKTDSGDWIAVHCSGSANGVTVGEAYSACFRYIRQPAFYPTEQELEEIQENKEKEGAVAEKTNRLDDLKAETKDEEKDASSEEISTVQQETQESGSNVEYSGNNTGSISFVENSDQPIISVTTSPNSSADTSAPAGVSDNGSAPEVAIREEKQPLTELEADLTASEEEDSQEPEEEASKEKETTEDQDLPTPTPEARVSAVEEAAEQGMWSDANERVEMSVTPGVTTYTEASELPMLNPAGKKEGKTVEKTTVNLPTPMPDAKIKMASEYPQAALAESTEKVEVNVTPAVTTYVEKSEIPMIIVTRKK